MEQEQKFYDKMWFIILMIIFIWPVGLYLLWKRGGTSKKVVKWLGIGFAALTVIVLITGLFTDITPPEITIDGESSLTVDMGQTMTESEIINKVVSNVSDDETSMTIDDVAINGYKDIDFETEGDYKISLVASDEANNETSVPFTISVQMSEKQKKAEQEAKQKAEQEAEEKKQAETEAANKEAKANRENEKALKSAQNYINIMAFSEQGLRNQLEFEGFTSEQIDYAIKNVDVDYKQEAVESATSYSNTLDMSGSAIYDQLIFEGYTAEQAQYGIDNY